ncbi:MAG: hypothetical protein JO356_17240 [Acidobacteria bacterium]|nr:hypothetical protein [Acidobacteriota bacterium]
MPTSFSILALNQAPCCTCAVPGEIRARLERGTQMLFDRACPNGGWNAGNSIVYGAPLPPHPNDTAVALLALGAQRQHALIRSSLRYLEEATLTLQAPSSLAWAVLALAAHNRPVDCLERSLERLPGLAKVEDTGTLAAVCLALDYRQSLSALGVRHAHAAS